jgi:GntP family gluconate:H+ symporter
LAKEAKLSLAGCAIALALGLYATHTMVPPTPGPIFAAAKLGADLGTVIFYGLLTSAFALLVGWAYAVWVGSRCYIDPAPELSEDALQQRMASAPCTIKAFIPIVLPLVLIVLQSIATYPTHPLGTGSLIPMLTFFGNPIVALCLGVLAAFFLPKQWDKSMFSSVGWVGDALHSAAIIILITGAGGAFGKVLQNAGIADAISGPLANLHLGIWLPFLIAAAIKTAQGSSTVAIVTTASLLAPLCAPLGFTSPDQLALVVIMIGAGSMVISHANDSYFWVVTQFSRMDLWTGYKFYSTGTLIEGLAAGGAVWLLYTFWL